MHVYLYKEYDIFSKNERLSIIKNVCCENMNKFERLKIYISTLKVYMRYCKQLFFHNILSYII